MDEDFNKSKGHDLVVRTEVETLHSAGSALEEQNLWVGGLEKELLEAQRGRQYVEQELWMTRAALEEAQRELEEVQSAQLPTVQRPLPDPLTT